MTNSKRKTLDQDQERHRSKKRTYYSSDAQEARFRAAFAARASKAGEEDTYPNINAYRLAAMDELAARLEATYNDGQPYPEAPARFPGGRPPTVA